MLVHRIPVCLKDYFSLVLSGVVKCTLISLLFLFNGMCGANIVSCVPSAAKEREKAQKAAAQRKASLTPSTSGYNTPTFRAMSPIGTPTKSSKKGGAGSRRSGANTPARTNSGGLDQMLLDLSAANLQPREEDSPTVEELSPRVAIEREKLLEQVRKELQVPGHGARKGVSLVVIGKSKVLP